MDLITRELSSFGRWFAVAKTTNLHLLSSDLSEILEEFSVKTKARSNKIIRRAAIKIWTAIIKITPVADGFAQGNWQIDFKLNDNELPNTTAIDVNTEMPKSLLNESIFLFNNLPYINKLEYGNPEQVLQTIKTTRDGHSIQAPHGMVRINVKNWKSELRKAARAIK